MWQKIKNYQETNYLRWNAFTFTGILLIIICGVNVTHNLDHYMDLLFWDESLYMKRGTMMFHSIPRDWGPAYSLWYKFLSFFISDKVALYYFNFKLTTILFSISLFILMLSCGVQRVLAFILAVFSLSAFINMPVWPHVSHFCIIVLITGIVISKYQHTLVSKFAVITFALMVCTYTRPEQFLSLFPILVITFSLFLINLKLATKKEIILLLLIAIFSVIIYRFFKTPFNNGDSQRGLGVFLQHFALNYSKWNPAKSPFWLDFMDIIQLEFKGAKTFKGLYAANPELIQHHFLSNFIFYITQTGKIIFSFFAPVFTKDFHWLCLMVSSMLLVIYFSFTKISENILRRFLTLLKNNVVTFLVLIFFTIPAVIICIYAYPRDHYLILQVPVLILILSLALSSITVEIIKPVQKIIVIATVWIFVMPVAEDFKYFNLYREEDSLANLKTVNFIRENLVITDSTRIFDLEGGMVNFLPPKYLIDYNLWKREKEQLSDYILRSNFDIIYSTPTLTALNSVQNDSVLFNILSEPEKYGYYKQKTGDFLPYLLIKIKK